MLIGILAEYNIAANDPLAAVIASLYAANLENIKKLNDIPAIYLETIQANNQEFRDIAKDLTVEIRGLFSQSEYDRMKEVTKGLSQAVERAVANHAKKIDRVSYKQLLIRWGLPALGVAALLAVGGSGFGYAVSLSDISQRGQARVLSDEEISALLWATTEDGKLARKVSDWNPGIIKQCQSNIDELKGRCVMRVIPPSSADPRLDLNNQG